MGEIYEARDLRLHPTVALKTVRASPTRVHSLLERLRRERSDPSFIQLIAELEPRWEKSMAEYR